MFQFLQKKSSGTVAIRKRSLRVEALEDRQMLSVNPFTHVTTPLDVVNANDNVVSLREAVTWANANPGAVITFEEGLGTITVDKKIDIKADMIFEGNGIDETVISGQGLTQIFYARQVGGVIDVTMSGLTVKDGNATFGAGIVAMDTNLTLDTVMLSNHVATTSGGAAVYQNGGTLTMIDCLVTGNVSEKGNGGAIASLNARTVSISGSEFTFNTTDKNVTSTWGGALYQLGGTLEVISTDFAGNSAGTGGAVYLYNVSSATFSGEGSFTDNQATLYGGAVMQRNSVVRATDILFAENYSKYLAGAVHIEGGGRFSGERVVFTGNIAELAGGAIYSRDGTKVDLAEAIFTNNEALGWHQTGSGAPGGAIVQVRGELNVTNSIFTGNKAPQGGAVALSGTLMSNFHSSVFTDNGTPCTKGGAIYFGENSRLVSVINSDFNGNIGEYGRAMYFTATSTVVGTLYTSRIEGVNITAADIGLSKNHPVYMAFFPQTTDDWLTLLRNATTARLGGNPIQSIIDVNPNGGTSMTLTIFGVPYSFTSSGAVNSTKTLMIDGIQFTLNVSGNGSWNITSP